MKYMRCKCGNLVMAGRVFDQQQTGVDDRRLIVSTNSIGVGRREKVLAKILSDTTIQLNCDQCFVSFKITVLRVDSTLEAVVSEFEDIKSPSKRRMTMPKRPPALTISFPPLLRPFVRDTTSSVQVSDSIFDDDPRSGRSDGVEDEMDMFREASDQVVGAYVEQWDIPAFDQQDM